MCPQNRKHFPMTGRLHVANRACTHVHFPKAKTMHACTIHVAPKYSHDNKHILTYRTRIGHMCAWRVCKTSAATRQRIEPNAPPSTFRNTHTHTHACDRATLLLTPLPPPPANQSERLSQSVRRLRSNRSHSLRRSQNSLAVGIVRKHRNKNAHETARFHRSSLGSARHLKRALDPHSQSRTARRRTSYTDTQTHTDKHCAQKWIAPASAKLTSSRIDFQFCRRIAPKYDRIWCKLIRPHTHTTNQLLHTTPPSCALLLLLLLPLQQPTRRDV